MATFRTAISAAAAPDVWECRYFFAQLPDAFERDRMLRRFPSVSGPFYDNDVYLLADDATKNIKLRKRTERIKLKRMIQREDDAFELWRTELDCALPAPLHAWKEVLSWLGINSDESTFLACSSADEALGALRGAVASLVYLASTKHRLFYPASPSTRIEASNIEINDAPLSTVVFESTDLADARALRDEFACELATPDNYVHLIRSIVLT
jgi:hypothetical protein